MGQRNIKVEKVESQKRLQGVPVSNTNFQLPNNNNKKELEESCDTCDF